MRRIGSAFTRDLPHDVALLSPLLLLFVLVTVLAPGSLRHGTDEVSYLGYAHNLVHGGYAESDPTNPPLFLWHGPGLPLLLAPMVALGVPLAVMRLIGPVALFAAVVVFARLLRLYVSPRAALAGAYALGLYWPFAALLPHILSEPIVVLALVISMYGTGRYLRGGRVRWLAVAGLSLGYAILTRQEYGWITVAMAAVVVIGLGLGRRWRPPLRRLGAIYGVALLMAVPWLAYTFTQTHTFPYWGNSGGSSLYWMASPYPQDLGDWHPDEDVFTDPDLARHRPFFASLRGESPLRQDQRLQSAALTNIRRHPGHYLRNVAANVSRMVFSFPYSYERQKLSALFYAVPNALLLGALALAGLLAAAGPSRRRRPSPEAFAFGLLAVVTVVAHTPVSGQTRMLMPIVPIAILAIVVVAARSLARPRGTARAT